MGYKLMVNKKNIFKVILVFLLSLGMMITYNISAKAESNVLNFQPKEGLVKVEGVQEYTDEQFNAAPVRITVFTASWCSYCKELKEKFPGIIYSKFSNNLVAIRVWQVDSPKVVEYFEKVADANKIQQELRGQIPFIFINEKYPYLGYSEEIVNDISEDIKAIFSEMEPPHGGNLEEDNPENNSIFNKDIKNNIENNKLSQQSKAYFIKAGFLDNFKLLFILLFSIVYIFILSFSKNNKIILTAAYFLGILGCNIFAMIYKVPLIISSKYTGTLKVVLYILSAVVVCELLVSLFTGEFANVDKYNHDKKSKNSSKDEKGNLFISLGFKLLNSKPMYLVSLILGFLVMNSQINNNNSYYISIFGGMSENLSFVNKLSMTLLYSIGILIVSIILTIIINFAKNIIKNKRYKEVRQYKA